MTARFAITFDYLCPFARNANEAVVEALESASKWEVDFRPFSLAQTKVEDGKIDVWDRDPGSEGTRGVLALQWGIAVRDNWNDQFLAFHLALFDTRHGHGSDIGNQEILVQTAQAAGLDAEAVIAEVNSGRPLKTLATEHSDLVSGWAVFGVPTFIVGEEAVFVRSMERHRPDDIQRIVDLVSWTNLNEFKRTRVPR
ncbi:MAG: DsbA family protein [Actinomycetota bacterium]|nr:DsbA family protein [Actinomycetota bacterium]